MKLRILFLLNPEFKYTIIFYVIFGLFNSMIFPSFCMFNENVDAIVAISDSNTTKDSIESMNVDLDLFINNLTNITDILTCNNDLEKQSPNFSSFAAGAIDHAGNQQSSAKRFQTEKVTELYKQLQSISQGQDGGDDDDPRKLNKIITHYFDYNL